MLLYVPIYKMINALTHTVFSDEITLSARKENVLQEMLRVGVLWQERQKTLY